MFHLKKAFVPALVAGILAAGSAAAAPAKIGSQLELVERADLEHQSVGQLIQRRLGTRPEVRVRIGRLEVKHLALRLEDEQRRFERLPHEVEEVTRSPKRVEIVGEVTRLRQARGDDAALETRRLHELAHAPTALDESVRRGFVSGVHC